MLVTARCISSPCASRSSPSARRAESPRRRVVQRRGEPLLPRHVEPVEPRDDRRGGPIAERALERVDGAPGAVHAAAAFVEAALLVAPADHLDRVAPATRARRGPASPAPPAPAPPAVAPAAERRAPRPARPPGAGGASRRVSRAAGVVQSSAGSKRPSASRNEAKTRVVDVVVLELARPRAAASSGLSAHDRVEQVVQQLGAKREPLGCRRAATPGRPAALRGSRPRRRWARCGRPRPASARAGPRRCAGGPCARSRPLPPTPKPRPRPRPRPRDARCDIASSLMRRLAGGTLFVVWQPRRAGVRVPLVLGHRGASARETENTAAAFRRAAHRRCRRRRARRLCCATGEVMVFHDDDLARLGGRPERIGDLPYRTLRDVKLPGGAPSPRWRRRWRPAGPTCWSTSSSRRTSSARGRDRRAGRGGGRGRSRGPTAPRARPGVVVQSARGPPLDAARAGGARGAALRARSRCCRCGAPGRPPGCGRARSTPSSSLCTPERVARLAAARLHGQRLDRRRAGRARACRRMGVDGVITNDPARDARRLWLPF